MKSKVTLSFLELIDEIEEIVNKFKVVMTTPQKHLDLMLGALEFSVETEMLIRGVSRQDDLGYCSEVPTRYIQMEGLDEVRDMVSDNLIKTKLFQEDKEVLGWRAVGPCLILIEYKEHEQEDF